MSPEVVGAILGSLLTGLTATIGGVVLTKLKSKSDETIAATSAQIQEKNATFGYYEGITATLKSMFEAAEERRKATERELLEARASAAVLDDARRAALKMARNWEGAYNAERNRRRAAEMRLTEQISGTIDRPLAGRRVLAVDDEPAVCRLLCEVLRTNGAEVRGAHSGEDALAILFEWGECELLISDLSMPAMDGYELLRRVRELPAPLGGIPAIAFSAHFDDETVSRALAAGFSVHLSKPLDLGQVAALATQLLRGE